MCTNTSSFSLSADKLKLIQHFTNVRAVVLWCNSGSAAVVCSSNVIAPVVAVVGAGVCVCGGATSITGEAPLVCTQAQANTQTQKQCNQCAQ